MKESHQNGEYLNKNVCYVTPTQWAAGGCSPLKALPGEGAPPQAGFFNDSCSQIMISLWKFITFGTPPSPTNPSSFPLPLSLSR